MNSSDVLGMVLSEAVIVLDNNAVEYTLQRIPMKPGDEKKIMRIIRQRVTKNSNTVELLIAYF